MKSTRNFWVGTLAVVVLGLGLWISSGDTLWAFAAPERVTATAQFPVPGGKPRGLAWDGQHLWLVDDLRNVYQLGDQGQVLQQFAIKFTPSGMTWDGTALWIGDDDNQLQVRFDTQGQELDSLPAYFAPNSGIAWDGTDLWVGDSSQGEFHRFSLTGEELEAFGIKDANIEHSSGLVFDGQNLWVGDSNEGVENNLAQFQTNGQLVADYNTRSWGLVPTQSPEYKAMAWDGQYLWYTADDMTKVYRIDVNAPPTEGQPHLFLPVMIVP